MLAFQKSFHAIHGLCHVLQLSSIHLNRASLSYTQVSVLVSMRTLYHHKHDGFCGISGVADVSGKKAAGKGGLFPSSPPLRTHAHLVERHCVWGSREE